MYILDSNIAIVMEIILSNSIKLFNIFSNHTWNIIYSISQVFTRFHWKFIIEKLALHFEQTIDGNFTNFRWFLPCVSLKFVDSFYSHNCSGNVLNEKELEKH